MDDSASADQKAGGLTRQLARQALAYRAAELPADAVTVAKQCILDWFGVTLPGSTEPCARVLTEELADGGRGPCAVVGTALRLSPHDAALANGTASHALDYDDVNAKMSGHPTVAVLPAVLAIAEAEGRTGREALVAFIAGYEIACALGVQVAPSHYAKGFHATGTVGAVGAAAAAGLLMALDEDQMEFALSLAATQSAGLKAMFGSMAKPLHAGKAAANGVLAARLAARGFDAQPGGLETAQGFITNLSDEDPARPIWLPSPGGEIVNTLFKYHAACYLTHSTIDALARARDAHQLSADNVIGIDLHVAEGHLRVCNIPDPVTGLEGKFSLRHAAALVLSRTDTAAIETYTDEVSLDGRLAGLRNLVTVHGDMPPGGAVRFVLRTTSGDKIECDHNTSAVARDLDQQGRRIRDKFRSLATPVIGADASERLEGMVGRVEDISSLAEVMDAARIPA